MANDPGFLTRLGMSPIDERAMMQAQRNAVFRGRGAEQRALGQQASPLIYGAGRAVEGLISGENEGRSLGGVKQNFLQGAREQDEFQVAQAAGLSVDQLRAHRAVKEALVRANIPNDGSFESRIRQAQVAAQTAMQVGDPDILGNALKEISSIRKEQEEFAKLSAQRAKAEKDLNDPTKDIWLRGENTPRSAILTPTGAQYVDDNGEVKFAPVGQYSHTDPSKDSKDDDDKPFRWWWKELVPASARVQIANAVTAAKDGNRKFRRIYSSLRDWSEIGGVESIMSTSGKALAFTDNIVRNAQGFVRPFLTNEEGIPVGKYKRDDGTFVTPEEERKQLTDISKFSIPLPEGVKEASAAAQNYQAQILELAYAVARMAEPSNRGLSDKDVESALRRLTADGSNPQVIFRRFAEMAGDSAMQIEDMIGAWDGQFQDRYTREEIIDMVGGSTYKRYKADMDSMFEEFGITINEDGRAVTERKLDSDLGPGEGIPQLPGAPGAQTPAVPQEDIDFLDQF